MQTLSCILHMSRERAAGVHAKAIRWWTAQTLEHWRPGSCAFSELNKLIADVLGVSVSAQSINVTELAHISEAGDWDSAFSSSFWIMNQVPGRLLVQSW